MLKKGDARTWEGGEGNDTEWVGEREEVKGEPTECLLRMPQGDLILYMAIKFLN